MPATKEQIDAARKALADERDRLSGDVVDTERHVRFLAQDIGNIDAAAHNQEANLGLLDHADRQLSTIRHQVAQLRRRARSIQKRVERQANGVFTV